MPSAMPYTDVHRAFLQAVSQHGTMSAKQAYKALLAIYAKCESFNPSRIRKNALNFNQQTSHSRPR